jgi:hypothetical protein
MFFSELMLAGGSVNIKGQMSDYQLSSLPQAFERFSSNSYVYFSKVMCKTHPAVVLVHCKGHF